MALADASATAQALRPLDILLKAVLLPLRCVLLLLNLVIVIHGIIME